MNSAEKAKELIEKFDSIVYPFLGSGMLSNTEDEDVILKNAKHCAQILCDEVIIALPVNTQDDHRTVIYWQEVKKEISK